jgi:hypothetical protein
VKVTGIPSIPLQESFTQAISGSGGDPPVSVRWLSPEPMLIWLGGAGVADAQKKTVPEMDWLVTAMRLFPQPASPPILQ